MIWFMYVPQSLKDGKYYIGMTSDIEARLKFHNSGKQRSTRHRLHFELIYSESYQSKKEAIAREKEVKAYKGGIQFYLMLSGCSPAQRDTTFGT